MSPIGRRACSVCAVAPSPSTNSHPPDMSASSLPPRLLEWARTFSPETVSRQVVTDVIFDHAESAAALWERRRFAVHGASYRLGDIEQLEHRIGIHLAGVWCAGRVGLDIVDELLELAGVGETFIGAVMAHWADDRPLLEKVLAQVSESEALAGGLAGALNWLGPSHAAETLELLRRAEAAPLRLAAVLADGVHGEAPRPEALVDESPLVRAAAFDVVGLLELTGYSNSLCRALLAEHSLADPCRWAAARSLRRLGSDVGDEWLHAQLVDPSRARIAVEYLARPRSLSWMRELHEHLASEPPTMLSAIALAGVMGTAESVSWLVTQAEQPEQPEIRPFVAEAVALATGVDLEFEDLIDAEYVCLDEPSDDPDDTRVDLSGDADLPRPNARALTDWWATQRPHYAPGSGRRHLLGRPLDHAAIGQALLGGTQGQRASASLEYQVRAARPGLDVAALVRYQREWMRQHRLDER